MAEIIGRVNRQMTDLEETNCHVGDRDIICNENIPRTLRDGKQKTNYPVKMAKSCKQAFCGRANLVASKRMTRCPNSLEVREMQIKVIMKLILNSTRPVERSSNADCWWNIEKEVREYFAKGKVNYFSPSESNLAIPFKDKNMSFLQLGNPSHGLSFMQMSPF